MTNDKSSDINKAYILGVSASTFLLPIISCYAEIFFYGEHQLFFEMIGKWFLFYAVGVQAGTNEKFALVTDIIIFALLLIYFIKTISVYKDTGKAI